VTPSICPDCGDDIKPRARKCSCGWIVPTAAAKAGNHQTPPSIDVEYGWCAWRSGGERCRHPGTVAHSTLGGGPWYCGEHFTCRDPIVGGQIVDESIAARGQRPDYSPEARVGGIMAKWQHDLVASGAYGKRITPQDLRGELDRTTTALTHHDERAA
jgi:hypothetical protein